MAKSVQLLCIPTELDLTNKTLVTAPTAGNKKIIRHIHVVNTSTGSITFTMGFGTPTSVNNQIFCQQLVSPHTTFDHYCSYSIVTGQPELQAFASVATGLTVTVTGEFLFIE